jgi:hypothetical protein
MANFKAFVNDMVAQVKNSNIELTLINEKEVFGKCPWCKAADVYRFLNKNVPKKANHYIFYCAAKCGWRLDTYDRTFTAMYLDRHLTNKEAVKFIANGTIKLSVKKKDGTGTYTKEFCFKKSESNGKVYCNVFGVPGIK